MSDLKNKNIILGVCGGIAAYKSAELVRLLIKQGAQVQVVMTHSAGEFVTPLTFQALSGRVARDTLFDLDAEAGMGHIELVRWADLILIAPATANTIAKITHGIADNLLSTICMASKAPLLIAPAMNQQMWINAAMQDNIKMLLRRQTVTLCGPAAGEQACGDTGPGRMEEPAQLLKRCITLLKSNQQLSGNQSPGKRLKGKKILITAGPTIEDIDPVRYMSNRSSGKMGYAIVQAAIDEGAEVVLVSGPTVLTAPAQAEFFMVRSALEMHDKVFELIDSADIFIATAAVADYRPVKKVEQKIKKNNTTLILELIKNPDILADVAALANKPLCIGFAAETNDVKNYALDKLKRKNLDMIVANKVGESQSGGNTGFEGDNNELNLYWNNPADRTELRTKNLPYASKYQLAGQLIDEIVLLFT